MSLFSDLMKTCKITAGDIVKVVQKVESGFCVRKQEFY